MTSAGRDLRILFINPFGIGDVLFTTPLIKAIKEGYPRSFIGYWCNERIAGVLRDNPQVDCIFALSRGDLKRVFQHSSFGGVTASIKIFRAIKKEKFDAALDFSLDHRYSLVAWLAGIKQRCGFDYRGRGRFLTDKVHLSGYTSRHVVEYYRELLKFLDIPVGEFPLQIGIAKASSDRIARLLNYEGVARGDLLIGIAPGAGGSWGRDAHLKQWPPLKFAQLADRLSSELNAQVIVLGDKLDKAAGDVLMNASRVKPIDFVGKTSLEDLVAAIASLRLLITNDGGPLHIAAGLGVKTVSIFGPVDEKVYGPYPGGKGHAVISASLDCRPCYKNFRMPFCDKDRECLKRITVDNVFNKVKEMLKR